MAQIENFLDAIFQQHCRTSAVIRLMFYDNTEIIIIPFSLKLTFKCTDNEAEYKTFIFDPELVIFTDIRRLNMYSDSQLAKIDIEDPLF